MWKPKLAGTGAGPAPLPQLFAVGAVFQNSSVAVTIRDEETPVWSKGNISCPIEGAAIVRLFAHSDGHELSAKGRILDDGGRTSVHCP